MIEEKLYFKTLEDVKSFVNIAMLKDFDLDFISGKYVVDAKSIMGIFSLDLTKPVKLVAHTDDQSLKDEIAPFVYNK